MKTVFFDGIKYKEFEASEEAYKWGLNFYKEIIEAKDFKTQETIAYYRGNLAKKYNNVMRRNPTIETKEFKKIAGKEFSPDGEQIAKIIHLYKLIKSYEIPENIILFRYTKKEHIKKLCKKRKIKKREKYQDKAFTSTTLVKNNLKNFAKENEYDCLLKIYTPTGIKGIYTQKTKNEGNDEQEVILKPLTQFEIVKVHHFTKPLIIEVKALLE